jgi:hypothetical protein
MTIYTLIIAGSIFFFLRICWTLFFCLIITKEFRHIDIVKLRLAVIGLILSGILLPFKDKWIDVSNSINNISLEYVGISFTNVVVIFFMFAILVGIIRSIRT